MWFIRNKNINTFNKDIIVRQVIIYTRAEGKHGKTFKHDVMHIEILDMRRLHKGSVILRKTKQSIYLQEIRAQRKFKKIHGRAVKF